MVEKVNGYSRKGDFIRRELDYYLVRTTLDITPTGVLSDPSQRRFDKLIETVSLRAQPIIIGDVFTTTEDVPVADLPVTLTVSASTVTVYNVRFAIEHEMAWENTSISLADSLDGIEGFVHTVPTTNNNVSVTRKEDL
jgi:hypothetical protein